MSGQPRRVEEAYEAIRAHHHERPYLGDAGRVYSDLGSLSQLLAALDQLVADITTAAERSTGADDGEVVAHRVDFGVWMETAQSALVRARGAVEDAHIHAGHLIFEATA